MISFKKTFRSVAVASALVMATTSGVHAASVVLTLTGATSSTVAEYGNILSSVPFTTCLNTDTVDNAALTAAKAETTLAQSNYDSSLSNITTTEASIVTNQATYDAAVVAFTADPSNTTLEAAQVAAATALATTQAQLVFDNEYKASTLIILDTKKATEALLDLGTVVNNQAVNNYSDKIKIAIDVTDNIITSSVAEYALYFMMVNLNAAGANDLTVTSVDGTNTAADIAAIATSADSQIYMFERDIGFSAVAGTTFSDPSSLKVVLYPDAKQMDIVAGGCVNEGCTAIGLGGDTPLAGKASVAYVPQASATANTYTDNVISSDGFSLEGYDLPQGTWMGIAILAKPDEIKFADARTWVSWDAKPIIFGNPLRSTLYNDTAFVDVWNSDSNDDGIQDTYDTGMGTPKSDSKDDLGKTLVCN